MWYGSAAICVNEQGQLLMVKQGKPEEKIAWALPAGGIDPGETYEDCCVRETWEETGYKVAVKKPVHIKHGNSFGSEVEVHFFEVELLGGTATLQDPDNLIHEIAWKTPEEIRSLEMMFPEDREFVLAYFAKVR